jgi:hypothetical protein
MPDEVINTLPPEPDVVELERLREELKQSLRRRYGTVVRAKGKTPDWDTHRVLSGRIGNARKKRLEEIKKEYRRHYFHRIHDEEMERQLKKIPTEEYIEPVIQRELPEWTRV